MALQIDEIIAELNDLGIDAAKVKEAEEAFRKLEEEKADDRAANKQPKQKNQFVIVLNSTSGNKSGWVLQLKEGDDAQTTLDRVKRAAKQQNTNMKKFIKSPLKSFGDAMQNLKRKFMN